MACVIMAYIVVAETTILPSPGIFFSSPGARLSHDVQIEGPEITGANLHKTFDRVVPVCNPKPQKKRTTVSRNPATSADLFPSCFPATEKKKRNLGKAQLFFPVNLSECF